MFRAENPVQDERERLDKLHNVFRLIFDRRLIFPPINNPQRILDCGFGSAAWAMEAAEKYPNCAVRVPIHKIAQLMRSGFFNGEC